MDNEMFSIILDYFPPPPPVSSNATARRNDDGSEAFSSVARDGDRISYLAEDLLRKIVAELPAKEGARTMSLSSPWRRIWKSVPLVLDDAQFLPAAAAAGGDDGSDAVVASAVSGALASHPGPFATVRLTSSSLHANEAALGNWVQAMAAKGVGDLVIINRHWPAALSLPDDILRCTSMERLHMALCHLPDILDRQQAVVVDLPRLRELVMYMDVTSSSLKCLVLWLFHPAELVLQDTPCLERLIICGKPHYFNHPPPSRVKITSVPPGLRALGYLNPSLHLLQIGETVIKAGTEASPALMIPTVETLGIKIKFGVEDEERILLSFLKLFPNVKNLYMMSTPPLMPLPVSEIDLKKFWWDNLWSVRFVRLKLTRFTFYYFYGEADGELAFVQCIAATARFLKEMRITLSCFVDRPDETKDELIDNLTSFRWASYTTQWNIYPADYCGEWDYKTASDMSRDPFDRFHR
ncbi:hypothetical protein ABZP36_025707 [Zizania latifolia]